jgi:glycosyltransferase involved in cell wall biosynthesis
MDVEARVLGVTSASGSFGVLHYIERWLPLSETFVHGIIVHSSHAGVVVTPSRLENVAVFPHKPVVSLAPLWYRTPEKVRDKMMTGVLAALAMRYRAKVVHVHHGYRAYEAKNMARRRNMPMVLSLHGDDVTGFLSDNPHAYRGVFEVVSAVVVPSQFLVEAAVAAGARPNTVHTIPSGVDTELFTPSPLPAGPPEALFVGRFVEKKGLDVLVEAWGAVRAAVPDARLRILGYGPLESLARLAGPGVEVVLGPDRVAVRDAVRRARVVVSPSRTAPGDAVESLLIVNLEAQASGRPVVTTCHGGIPEFVRDGETALLVPEADSVALADALITLLTDDALAARLGSAGPAWAAEFDVRRCAARIDALYESLV